MRAIKQINRAGTQTYTDQFYCETKAKESNYYWNTALPNQPNRHPKEEVDELLV